MKDETFNKIIVSKFSPQNGCFVEEGKCLSIIPLKSFPKGKSVISYYFTDVSKRNIKSKYGWVKQVEPFTLDDFVKKYLKKEVEDELELEHLRILLSSIKKLDSDSPVGVLYKTRLEDYKTRMVLVIHKVKFY